MKMKRCTRCSRKFVPNLRRAVVGVTLCVICLGGGGGFQGLGDTRPVSGWRATSHSTAPAPAPDIELRGYWITLPTDTG